MSTNEKALDHDALMREIRSSADARSMRMKKLMEECATKSSAATNPQE